MSRSMKISSKRSVLDKECRDGDYAVMIECGNPDTWAAKMPAYCFTSLCPDKRYVEYRSGIDIKWEIGG